MKAVVTHSISEYIIKNQKRASIHWRCSSEEHIFFHNGKWYKEDLFDKYYPVYEYKKFNDKGVNPDKKRVP